MLLNEVVEVVAAWVAIHQSKLFSRPDTWCLQDGYPNRLGNPGSISSDRGEYSYRIWKPRDGFLEAGSCDGIIEPGLECVATRLWTSTRATDAWDSNLSVCVQTSTEPTLA